MSGSLHSRAKLATAGLVAVGVVHVAVAAVAVWLLELLARADAGYAVDHAQLLWIVDFCDELDRAYVLAMLVTVAAFISWFAAAYENARALQPRLPRRPRHVAVWSWFVPFACLVLPYQIARDTWVGSERDPEKGAAERGLALVKLWWAAWLAATATKCLLMRPDADPTSVVEATSLIHRAIASNIAYAVATVLAICFVLQTTRRQQAALASARVVGRVV